MSAPAISVVLPTYQRAHTVSEATLSVLQQTFGDFELLVVDDGSTDGTAEAVATFCDPRLHLVSIAHGGRSRARNEGVARARGEVVLFLDSDDQVSPFWLERMYPAFADARVAIVCCGARVTTERPGVSLPEEEIIMPNRFDIHSSRIGLFRAGTFAVRRSVFEAAGGYDCRLEFSENTELAIRLMMLCEERAFSCATVYEPLVWIRRRPSPGGRAEFRARLEAAELMIRRHGERYRHAPPSFGANFRAIAAVNAYRLGLSGRAFRHSLAAAAANPGRLAHWGRLTLGLVPPLARRFWTRQLDTGPMNATWKPGRQDT